MTNEQLLNEFNRIYNMRNPFDTLIELKKFQPIYKKTDFCKQTHMKIKQTYEWYVANQVCDIIKEIKKYTDTYYIADKLNDVVENLDFSVLEGFANKIISFLDINNIQSMKGELQKAITGLKRME